MIPSHVIWVMSWVLLTTVITWFVARWVYKEPEEGPFVDLSKIPAGWLTSEFWMSLVAKVGVLLVAFGVTQTTSDQITTQLSVAVSGGFAIVALWQMAKNYTQSRTEIKLTAMKMEGPNKEEGTNPVSIPSTVRHTIGLVLLLGLGLGLVAPARAEVLPWRQQVANQLKGLQAQQAHPAPVAPQPPQIIVVPGGPQQQIPLGGPPLQQIPLGGPPLQQIPLGGPPLQQIPLGGPPQQLIPLGPAPQQQIPIGQVPPQQIFLGPQNGVPPSQQPIAQPQPQVPHQQIPLGVPRQSFPNIGPPVQDLGPPATIQRLNFVKALYR